MGQRDIHKLSLNNSGEVGPQKIRECPPETKKPILGAEASGKVERGVVWARARTHTHTHTHTHLHIFVTIAMVSLITFKDIGPARRRRDRGDFLGLSRGDGDLQGRPLLIGPSSR